MPSCWQAELGPRSRSPRVGVGLLVDEAGPKARAGWLVGVARAQGVLGIIPAHWWMEVVPRVSGCRALEVLGLVPAYWYVGLGPGPTGGHGHVQGKVWAQGVLRQPVCWYVGLCPCPAGCLA